MMKNISDCALRCRVECQDILGQGRKTDAVGRPEVGRPQLSRTRQLSIAHAHAPEHLDAVDVGVERDGGVAAGDA